MFGKKDKDGLEPAQVKERLQSIVDPELEKSLDEAGFLGDVQVDEKRVRIEVILPTPAWAAKPVLEGRVREATSDLLDGREIDLAWTSEVKRSRQSSANDLLPGAKNILLFASGKGGVGKSTVATNVAAGLAARGASVGLLDADIYGPSVPTMLGTEERPEVSGQKLIPVHRHGVKIMSIGFIVKPEEAMVWRGPMLNGALTQFMRDVEWGELDYLIVDMPPGTGDVQLTIAQNIKVSGAVLVSTPQDVALADVVRGKSMFDKVDIPVLGVIENMAYFVCGGCGARHDIFSSGGAGQLAKKMSMPLLGEVPIDIPAREASDAGRPVVLSHPDAASSQAFFQVADTAATHLAKMARKVTAKPSGLKIIQ
jgi:ATP-binding protein involved in chromosome partitioning